MRHAASVEAQQTRAGGRRADLDDGRGRVPADVVMRPVNAASERHLNFVPDDIGIDQLTAGGADRLAERQQGRHLYGRGVAENDLHVVVVVERMRRGTVCHGRPGGRRPFRLADDRGWTRPPIRDALAHFDRTEIIRAGDHAGHRILEGLRRPFRCQFGPVCRDLGAPVRQSFQHGFIRSPHLVERHIEFSAFGFVRLKRLSISMAHRPPISNPLIKVLAAA